MSADYCMVTGDHFGIGSGQITQGSERDRLLNALLDAFMLLLKNPGDPQVSSQIMTVTASTVLSNLRGYGFWPMGGTITYVYDTTDLKRAAAVSWKQRYWLAAPHAGDRIEIVDFSAGFCCGDHPGAPELPALHWDWYEDLEARFVRYAATREDTRAIRALTKNNRWMKARVMPVTDSVLQALGWHRKDKGPPLQ